MKSNVGTLDRGVRLILGIFLLAMPFVSGLALFGGTVATIISVVLGIVLIATAGMKFCPLYRLLGVQTCKI